MNIQENASMIELRKLFKREVYNGRLLREQTSAEQWRPRGSQVRMYMHAKSGEQDLPWGFHILPWCCARGKKILPAVKWVLFLQSRMSHVITC